MTNNQIESQFFNSQEIKTFNVPPPTTVTHWIARICVKPLVGSPITPNQITTVRFLMGLTACAAFAVGEHSWNIWGGLLWVLSAFLDRADGELARISGLASKWGQVYDTTCDVVVDTLFFIAIGIGLRDSFLGPWSIVMGVVAGLSVLIITYLLWATEEQPDSDKKVFPKIGCFDIDDVYYLFGPVAWFNLLLPFLIGASIGAPILNVHLALPIRVSRQAIAIL
jgi:phosphatidylglycerophosphate synthase